MNLVSRTAWRALPWDPHAPDGAPFSVSYIAPYQGQGRFDLPNEPAGVLYLAESPEHAIAEKIQDLRNQTLEPDDLLVRGHPYALTEVDLPAAVFAGMADLCDPATVGELRVPPDEVAALSRRTTQRISIRLLGEGYTGLRWWSVFRGEWHNLVVFRERVADPPVYGRPRVLTVDDPALREIARLLNIEIRA